MRTEKWNPYTRRNINLFLVINGIRLGRYGWVAGEQHIGMIKKMVLFICLDKQHEQSWFKGVEVACLRLISLSTFEKECYNSMIWETALI